MTNTKNNLPLFEEQKQIVNEEQKIEQIEEILSQFQQLVPVNFIQLETKERNYMCSTQGWKEPVCERYIFFNNGKPVQLDIPQELMDKLELTKGKDIPYSVYIPSSVLKKNKVCEGITIENKEEIFIQKPLTINN